MIIRNHRNLIRRVLAVAVFQSFAVGIVVATCTWSYFFNDCVGYGCPMDCWEYDRSNVATSCCENTSVNCLQCNFQTIWCTNGDETCSNGFAATRYVFGGEYECGPNPLVCHT